MTTTTLTEQVHQIADRLPAGATWEDVLYQIELRASIERGMADGKAGRLIALEELLVEFGIARKIHVSPVPFPVPSLSPVLLDEKLWVSGFPASFRGVQQESEGADGAAVPCELAVDGEQDQRLGQGLSDQQAIEGVAMVV
jgi:hypothetical protein